MKLGDNLIQKSADFLSITSTKHPDGQHIVVCNTCKKVLYDSFKGGILLPEELVIRIRITDHMKDSPKCKFIAILST